MDPVTTQWLGRIAKTGLGWVTLNQIRTIFPLIALQSDKAAELFMKAKGRVAEIKAIEQMVQSEVDTRNTVRRALIERGVAATPEDRIEIEHKLEWLDRITRQLDISLKSLNYCKKAPDLAGEDESKIITDHWIDRFNELARKRNEEWRAELLARALAAETSAPGSVSARLLWLIGVLEESAFEAFSTLLNTCVWFASKPDPGPFVPDSFTKAFNQLTDIQIRGHYATVGELHTTLADTGLICDTFSSRQTIHTGSWFYVRHGDQCFKVVLLRELSTSGILLSTLGKSLAKFHEPVWTKSGVTILKGWLDSLPPYVAQVTPLDASELDEDDTAS